MSDCKKETRTTHVFDWYDAELNVGQIADAFDTVSSLASIVSIEYNQMDKRLIVVTEES